MSDTLPIRTRKDSEKDSTRSSTSSNYNLNQNKTEILARDGSIITSVGTSTSQPVPIDLLQSLYLGRRQSIQSQSDLTGSNSGRSTPALPSQPVPNSDEPQVHAQTSRQFGRNTPPVAFWPSSVSYTSTTTFPSVRKLTARERKRILVTGGGGYVGSHLVDRLMLMGHDVVVLDNFFSGSKSNLSNWIGHPNFELVRADVVEPFMVEVDEIYHLACPASPKSYQYNPIKTLKTNFNGTLNMLGLAKRVNAKFLLTSTSEIYGSPLVHPQREDYWGNVNPIGQRACYDEGKRVAEALTYGYARQDGVDVRVARIFNCYGPRLNRDDGRLVSNFIVAALRGEPIEIYGDGKQTRSLIYVQDLISGLIALMNSNFTDPVNLGSEDEATVEEWATLILETVEKLRKSGELPPAPFGELLNEKGERQEKKSEIIFVDAVVDDPPRRRPDIDRAKKELSWEPKWTIEAGLIETIFYFQSVEEGEM